MVIGGAWEAATLTPLFQANAPHTMHHYNQIIAKIATTFLAKSAFQEFGEVVQRASHWSASPG